MINTKQVLTPVLKVENLVKNFTSGFWPFQKSISHPVVNDITFQVEKGEMLGFLGPNGAGKTTTIQMLLGTLTPTSGSINYFGKDFNQDRILALKKIGYASGYDKLPARLTVMGNLDIVARIYGFNAAERKKQIEKLLKSFGIWNLRDRATGSLSAGQATRVMLVKAFIGDPQIVLLDEPTASLDPDVAHDVRQFIKKQRAEYNLSVLITSHNMDEVTELCDRVIVLKNGVIIANDTPTNLTKTLNKSVLHLNIVNNLENVISCLNKTQLNYNLQDSNLTVELEEHTIAPFLINLSEHKITYSHISINQPTLEDYFLSVAKAKKENSK